MIDSGKKDAFGNTINFGDTMIMAVAYGRAQKCEVREAHSLSNTGRLKVLMKSYGGNLKETYVNYPDRMINITALGANLKLGDVNE